MSRPASGERPTIQDVAVAAGVSVATVSRALRGLPNVALPTRVRVEAAARELEYRPDPHASRLAAGRSRCVAVVVPFINSWYFANVIAGIEAVCADGGYDLLVMTAPTPAARGSAVADVRPRPPCRRHDLRRGGVGRRRDRRPRAAGARRGHDRPAHGAASRRSASTTSRWAGWRWPTSSSSATRASASWPGRPRIRSTSTSPATASRGPGWRSGTRSTATSSSPGQFTVEGGRRAAAVLLVRAAVADGDLRAVRRDGVRCAHRGARARRSTIPGDVSLVGVDDHEIAAGDGPDDGAPARRRTRRARRRHAAAPARGDAGAAGGPAHEVRPLELVVRSSTRPRGAGP